MKILVLVLTVKVTILQMLNVTTTVLDAHMKTMMKARHHFCHQTFDFVHLLRLLTNLLLEIVRCL